MLKLENDAARKLKPNLHRPSNNCRQLAFITTLRILILLLLAIWSRAQEVGLKTRAELSNYQETSRYADVIAFFGQLEKESPLLHLQTFGRSHEGRDLPLVIISEPPLTTPREARDSG